MLRSAGSAIISVVNLSLLLLFKVIARTGAESRGRCRGGAGTLAGTGAGAEAGAGSGAGAAENVNISLLVGAPWPPTVYAPITTDTIALPTWSTRERCSKCRALQKKL